MADSKGGFGAPTGLEYKRTVDEAAEQKKKIAASIELMYTIASYVFAVGLFAVGALCIISFINHTPRIAIACEIVVFICLILLLILIGRAKRRINEQRTQSERYPYKSVNKKEIDNIFDLIADEEKKRERMDRFAAGNTSGETRRNEPDPPPRSTEAPAAKQEKASSAAPASTRPEPPAADQPEEDSGIIHIFPEEEEMVSVLDDELDAVVTVKSEKTEDTSDTSAAEEKESKEAAEADTDDKPSEKAADDAEERPKKKRPRNPDGSPRPAGSGKRSPQGQGSRPRRPDGAPARDPRDPRARQQAPRDGSQSGKKRRPPQGYDPYYGGGYYYDEYGRPIRRPPPYDPYYGGGYYYDEYGTPVRRREAPYGAEGAVMYDEYGRPIRRRPPQGYDPRREEAMRKKRSSSADPTRQQRRPEPPKQGSAAAAGEGTPAARRSAAPQQPDADRRTAAPVAMPSRNKDFDEDRVVVSIPDFDDQSTYDYEAERRARMERSRRQEAAKQPPAAPRRTVMDDESEYNPAEMEATPIVIPDDDYFSRYDDEDTYASENRASRPAEPSYAPPQKARQVPDYHYEVEELSPEERDTGVVVVPDFDDFDEEEYSDRYARGRYRSSANDDVREQAYQPPVNPDRQSSKAAVEEESYSYEDEGVIVLPHDEGYESYLEKVKEEEEKKRIEERKQARKASGKIALTIRKVRRRKIRRMSRKYKRFRASVIPLAKYLNSYS